VGYGHTVPVVNDLQPDPVGGGVSGQPDRLVRWAGGSGVGDQVGDDTFEQAGVGAGEREVVGNVDLDDRITASGVQQRLGDHGVECHRPGVDAEHAGLQAAHRQQVVHQSVQPVGRFFDGGE